MLANVYFKLGQDAEAMKNILLAEDLANKVGARADLKEIYQTRAEIEQKAGNYKKAAEYLSKRIVISDSLFEVQTSEKIAEVKQSTRMKKQLVITQLEDEKKIQAYSIRQKSVLNYI
jgi:tetratricopeptide (TPR) repeat protein